MPSVSSGMNDDVAAALLAVSGAATPSMAPRPNRSGVLETRFSTAYAASEASTAPPPGSTPRTKPITEPRPIAPEDCLRSSREGQMLATAAGHVRLAVALLEVVEDLADAEQAHRDDDEVEAVGELQAVEGEPAGAGELVAADGGQQQPERGGDRAP